jgi:glycerol kinase
VERLRVDGGAIRNQFIAQFQADILGCLVERPRVTETTALGAAFLAGLAVGVWRNQGELAAIWQKDAEFSPNMEAAEREARYRRWRQAVERAQGWAAPRE